MALLLQVTGQSFPKLVFDLRTNEVLKRFLSLPLWAIGNKEVATYIEITAIQAFEVLGLPNGAHHHPTVRTPNSLTQIFKWETTLEMTAKCGKLYRFAK